MSKLFSKILIMSIALVIGGGCACLKGKCPPKAQPATVAAKAPAPAPAPKVEKGKCAECMMSNMYPCSECGVIKLHKEMPAEVMANKPFEYTIDVINLTDMPLSNIVVTDQIMKNFKYSGSVPEAKVDGNKLMWTMDSLAPNATKRIKVMGAAGEPGAIQTCGKVSYDILTCAATNAVQPALKLTKEAPAEAMLCDNIPLKFTVTNTGSGTTSNVVIKDALPEGLMLADGKKSIMVQVGDLASGQAKAYSAMVKAQKTGTYVNKATATADGDLTTDSGETKTIVRQPVLAITKTAPEKVIVGREVTYDIKVTNKGDVTAANAMIKDMSPAGAAFVKASDGGASGGGAVTWNIGSLAPDASKNVTVTYKPTGAGEISNKAVAMATCAEDVSAMAKTTAIGVPGVLLEVVDLEDPVIMGNNITYVITVTNQGFAPLTNVAVVATIEEHFKYVSSSGPSAGAITDNILTFAPIPTLNAKSTATWKVIVKTTAAGNHIFTVTLKSNELGGVQETESTNVYE
jgi:uncharacterized repeat protein (TIGR01451 family)